MVEDKIINIVDLKDLSKAFIDNNGENACDYCNGEQLITSSDKPSEAVIFLKHDALTNYGAFILAQDEISKAYYDLRSNYVKKVLNKSSEELTKKELQVVKKAYPFILFEVKVERN